MGYQKTAEETADLIGNKIVNNKQNLKINIIIQG